MLMAVAFATLLVSSAIAGSPPKGRFGVGDSIMLSAKPELRPLGYGVNASVGRQFGAGVWIVRHKAEDGTLPKRVIVHLGTNGTIDPGDCDRLVGYAGPKRRVLPRHDHGASAWEEPNNETLNACANAHDKVHIDPLAPRATDHPEWFAPDGYHVNAEGQARVRVARRPGRGRDDRRSPGGTRPLARLVAVACPSGRRDTPGKRVGGQLPRGFESLGHRRSRCGDAQSSVSCFVYA